MKTLHIIFLGFLILLSGCAVFNRNRTVDKIKMEYSTEANINYGYSFKLNTILVYTDGKEKKITGKKELTVTASGATYQNGRLYIDGYPDSLKKDVIEVKATYVQDEKSHTVSETIPFNYNGELKIDFSGKAGAEGNSARNRSTPLIGRNGNDGDHGTDGAAGENGHDLTVNIWKMAKTDMYGVKVVDLVDNNVYYYRYKDKGFGIRILVNGGNGGNGGDGGDGGNGKEGSIKDGKNKSPGDGGNGGNGGNGAIGGNGGTVYVFLHTNANEIQRKITVLNHGGQGGKLGQAGDAGKAGAAAAGQNAAQGGQKGIGGVPGTMGNQGEPVEIIIEDFDYE